jgi:beta-lactamase regulating signal transducer with metallopeptidase domain
MIDVFYWILNMSILGSLLGAMLLLLRKIKRLPRFFIYLLWGLVLIRLICPVGVVSGFSLLNILPRGSTRIIPANEVLSVEQARLLMTNFVQNAKEYQPLEFKSDGLREFYQVAFVVWIVVAIIAIQGNLILYYLTGKELKKAIHLQDRIYESDRAFTPMVYGMIRPRIILPTGVIREDNISYLLAHENTHLRRHDNAWRFLAILVTCIHWFNPIVWLFLKKFREDMELACDEGTIRRMKVEERKQYAFTLLAYAKKETKLYASSFGGSKVKLRIERVVSYRNLTLVSTCGFCLLFLLLVVFMLSNR